MGPADQVAVPQEPQPGNIPLEPESPGGHPISPPPSKLQKLFPSTGNPILFPLPLQTTHCLVAPLQNPLSFLEIEDLGHMSPKELLLSPVPLLPTPLPQAMSPETADGGQGGKEMRKTHSQKRKTETIIIGSVLPCTLA